DVYDKLLVLQALRQEFPKATFFTTDLDARMLHPSEVTWTRNLIVASSFGLELRRPLQHGIPPFRDSSQSASFLAAQVAFISAPDRKQDAQEYRKYQEGLGTMIPVRVFEIGRHVAVDLSVDGPSRGGRACDTLRACNYVHPD